MARAPLWPAVIITLKVTTWAAGRDTSFMDRNPDSKRPTGRALLHLLGWEAPRCRRIQLGLGLVTHVDSQSQPVSKTLSQRRWQQHSLFFLTLVSGLTDVWYVKIDEGLASLMDVTSFIYRLQFFRVSISWCWWVMGNHFPSLRNKKWVCSWRLGPQIQAAMASAQNSFSHIPFLLIISCQPHHPKTGPITWPGHSQFSGAEIDSRPRDMTVSSLMKGYVENNLLVPSRFRVLGR